MNKPMKNSRLLKKMGAQLTALVDHQRNLNETHRRRWYFTILLETLRWFIALIL